MSRVGVLSVLIATFFALHTNPSYADDEVAKPAFGHAGQFALSLNQGFAVNTTDLLDGSGIQASVFVAPHLSIGIAASAQWLSESSLVSSAATNNFILHLGPRIGYDIPFSESVSFWPQVGVDYRMNQGSASTSTTTSDGTGAVSTSTSSTSVTSSAFGLSIVAPIVIHPSRGFFIGAGPAFYTEFSNSTSEGSASVNNSKITSLGLMALVGGAI